MGDVKNAYGNINPHELLTDEEKVRVNEWLKTIPKLKVYGAIGGYLTYSLTPTGLGTVVKIIYAQGTTKEAVLDLTDYASW